MMVWDGESSWSMVFLPVLLATLCAVTLSPWAPAFGSRLQRNAPWMAVAALAVLGGVFVARKGRRRELEASVAALKVLDAQKDASLRGLPRAAWLLANELSYMDGYREEDFLHGGVFRLPRGQGEYRWDEGKGRLVFVETLFGERFGLREKLLPFADRALHSELMRPGARPDLAGGVLACGPPLECTVTWEFDVDALHAGERVLRPSASGLEQRVFRECYSQSR
jgi:hypothetical protein